MTGSEPDVPEPRVRYTVLSHRAIAWWAVLVVGVGVGMAVWLLWTYGGGDPRVQLDAIRTAGTIVVGTGGAAALLLAARRQRTAEIALRQKDRDQADVARAHALQERAAAAAEKDAEERRITELYTRAAEQLGSDKAPVRLAGMYALERLAQDNPGQRQTIVNLLCAYLRMPYTLPGEPSDDNAAEHLERAQEREVRLTAQRLLTTHLRVGDSADTFWADIDLDLTGAVLINFDLRTCHPRTARFTQATFAGITSFAGAEFTDVVWFDRATFAGITWFGKAEFASPAWFDGATFAGTAWFDGVEFAGNVSFDGTTFAGEARFEGATFAGTAGFGKAEFTGPAWFVGAEFTDVVWFDGATFGDFAWFERVEFAGNASFDRVTFGDIARFSEATFADIAHFRKARFADDARFTQATFAGSTSFDGVEFADNAPSGEATVPAAPVSGKTSFSRVAFARSVPAEVRRFWSPPATADHPPRRTDR